MGARRQHSPSELQHSDALPGSRLPANDETGADLPTVEALAGQVLSDGFSLEWTDLCYVQLQAGNSSLVVFGISVLFVFLVLAALYQSWFLSFAVILMVPMCLFALLVGVGLRGFDSIILTQTGLIVLIGIASRTAIRIVAFAREAHARAASRIDAALEAFAGSAS